MASYTIPASVALSFQLLISTVNTYQKAVQLSLKNSKLTFDSNSAALSSWYNTNIFPYVKADSSSQATITLPATPTDSGTAIKYISAWRAAFYTVRSSLITTLPPSVLTSLDKVFSNITSVNNK
jgi:hypothetical protein